MIINLKFNMRNLNFIFFLIYINCSTTSFHKAEDYRPSLEEMKKGNLSLAIKQLPNSEESFITTLEKTYLKLLNNQIELDALEEYEKKMEHRVRFQVSRELKDFFYVDTPEGYYASEHEILWMHLILAWGYSKENKFEKAAIQAKKVANYLNGDWSHEGRFDDPMIRIFLASIWAGINEWEEARVEFRAIYFLNPKWNWAKNLADKETKPESLILILGYPGREPVWNPKIDYNILRGLRDMDFQSDGNRSNIKIKNNFDEVSMNISTNSKHWYKRHIERDNEINELIQDSKYGQQLALNLTKGTLNGGAGIVIGSLVAIGGVGIGGGIAYLSAEAGSGDGVAAGIGLAFIGIVKGYEIAENSVVEAKKEFFKDSNISDKYRYVRFLPDYVWIGHSTQKLNAELVLVNKSKNQIKKIFNQNQNVNYFFYPDSIINLESYQKQEKKELQ